MLLKEADLSGFLALIDISPTKKLLIYFLFHFSVLTSFYMSLKEHLDQQKLEGLVAERNLDEAPEQVSLDS